MQRGYCSVATRYSPALIRNQALSSPEATLKVSLDFINLRSPTSSDSLKQADARAVLLRLLLVVRLL